jgi:hypothetical protein
MARANSLHANNFPRAEKAVRQAILVCIARNSVEGRKPRAIMFLNRNALKSEPQEKISSAHKRLASKRTMTAMECHIAIVPISSWHSSLKAGKGKLSKVRNCLEALVGKMLVGLRPADHRIHGASHQSQFRQQNPTFNSGSK